MKNSKSPWPYIVQNDSRPTDSIALL